jgi:two-component system sensor histidine kinase HydH
MNGKRYEKKRFWAVIPPWLIIGAVVILVPVFIFMTIENINRQKKQTTRLLVEKGAASSSRSSSWRRPSSRTSTT